MHSIAAIVVNYNAGPLLEACVASWLRTVPAAPLVLVDNASVDGSTGFVDSLEERERVIVIRNRDNAGFSVAVNQGIAAVAADYLLILNPDCLLEQGAVQHMMAAFGSMKQVGMVGPLLLNPDGTEQAGGRRAVPTPWRSLVRATGLARLGARYPRLFSDFYLHTQPLPEQPIEVEAISGACMLVHRSALEDIGLMDEGYFMHCEDLDWCMRFRRNRWKILFVPDAAVIHDRGACSRERRVRVEWHKHRGMLRFYRKFFRHQYPGVLMWFVVLGVWLRFCAVAGYYGVQTAGRRIMGKPAGN